MLPETISKQILVKRVARIEGQIRGIQRMLEDDCECESVITQLVATRSAIDSTAKLLLNNYMTICFNHEGTPDCSNIESLARAMAVWGRVDIGD